MARPGNASRVTRDLRFPRREKSSNLRGTGTLLSITPSGSYAVRTWDTVDRPKTGTVTVSGAGSLNFTPASAPTCTARYESVSSRNSTMDATLATGSCGRLGGASDTWIRIN